MRAVSFRLNGEPVRVTVDDERILLWVLRYDLGLTGTKFGCGASLCGACTVIVNNEAVRSCSTRIKDVARKRVLTIEGLSRRDFLVSVAGSGLLVLFRLDPLLAQEPAHLPTRQGYPTDFNAYLRIGQDGRTTCFAGKVELGQGAMTSLAQLVAEELDVSFDSIDMVLGDTDLCPWDMGTFGSLTIRQFGPVLRGAAAEARAVLLQLAAERLQLPLEQLAAKAGAISDARDRGRRVTYAQLVQGKRLKRHLEKVPVKPVSAFVVVGKPAARKDALTKVTGKAKYAGDIGLPGTLHGRIVRPPAHEATLKDVDTSAAEKITGASIVRDGDLVAVLHKHPDVAEQALALVKAEFDRPVPTVDEKTIFDHLLKAAPQGQVVGESGSLEEGERLAATLFDLTYLNGYVSHATMETHSAVAKIENGKATVWVSTQAPFMVKTQVAQALGFTLQNVRIVTPYVGGGFGGKTLARQAVEAARLAKIVGKPVQVVWDRTEEFFYDTFRPAAVVKIRSPLGRGARPRSTRTHSRPNRTSTSWPRRPASTHWSFA